MVSRHRCILRADNTAWLLACFLEKQTPLGPCEWQREWSSGTSSPWACEGGGPASRGTGRTWHRPQQQRTTRLRGGPSRVCARPGQSSCPLRQGGPRGWGLTAGVSSGAGQGAGGGHAAGGGGTWARPGGQSPLIAAGTAGQGGCGQAALCPARSQPANGGALAKPSPGPALCSCESGGLGATAPGGLLTTLSAVVTGSWASGKAGRPLADP